MISRAGRQRSAPFGGQDIVRKLPVAIMASLLGHGAAIAWVIDDAAVDPAVATAVDRSPDPPPAAPRTPDDEPMAVVLFEAPRPGPGSPDAPSAAAPRERREPPQGGPAIATGAPAGPEPSRGEPAGRSLLTMRRRDPVTGGMSPGFLEDFLARSKPVPPPPDIPDERLADEIADARRRLRHAAREGLAQADALRYEIVELNKQRAAEELKPAGGGTFKADKRTFTAKVGLDGTVDLQDKPLALDPQDRLMLEQGIDPYARAKLAFLDRTRDQRAAVGERHRRVLLSRSAQLMQRNIDQLWASTADLAARKAGLFELWDDCAETGSDELIAGGAAARRMVLGAIRGRLRGEAAYTSDELAQLNARRRSKAVFAPYEE